MGGIHRFSPPSFNSSSTTVNEEKDHHVQLHKVLKLVVLRSKRRCAVDDPDVAHENPTPLLQRAAGVSMRQLVVPQQGIDHRIRRILHQVQAVGPLAPLQPHRHRHPVVPRPHQLGAAGVVLVTVVVDRVGRGHHQPLHVVDALQHGLQACPAVHQYRLLLRLRWLLLRCCCSFACSWLVPEYWRGRNRRRAHNSCCSCNRTVLHSPLHSARTISLTSSSATASSTAACTMSQTSCFTSCFTCLTHCYRNSVIALDTPSGNGSMMIPEPLRRRRRLPLSDCC